MSYDEEDTSCGETAWSIVRNQCDEERETHVEGEGSQAWCGFKLVGDNIDKNVRPRHETIER